MKNIRCKFCIISIALVVFSFSLAALCQAEDIESKYFTINVYQGCNLAEFAQRIGAITSVNIEDKSRAPKDIKAIIADGIDSLYSEVSDILDIHMYSFHGKIRVFLNKQEMLAASLHGINTEASDLPSLYIPTENTIYISFPEASVGIISHEMAHAIISGYFVTPPSPKIQEILAGYVEYSVRKKSGDLPKNRR